MVNIAPDSGFFQNPLCASRMLGIGSDGSKLVRGCVLKKELELGTGSATRERQA